MPPAPAIELSEDEITQCGEDLQNKKLGLDKRFRALFTLKNAGTPHAIELIGKCFDDPSALLKHELAYCLGQIGDAAAIEILKRVLEDKSQEPMVRHEAGEALGAIGDSSIIEVLEKYQCDEFPEVAQTCELALDRLKWLKNPDCSAEELSANPYYSVDPAPPFPKTFSDVTKLGELLVDESRSLWERYRAMFSLRNIGTEAAVHALAKGLDCKDSALFRHEIGFVLGQVQSPECILALRRRLEDHAENCMVRHECAEALGAIATDDCTALLKAFLHDPDRVVHESCEVALDITDYELNGFT